METAKTGNEARLLEMEQMSLDQLQAIVDDASAYIRRLIDQSNGPLAITAEATRILDAKTADSQLAGQVIKKKIGSKK